MGVLRGVTVMNDFIRPDRDGNPGEGDRSAVWLFDVVKRPVALACGLDVGLLTARNCTALYRWVQSARPPEDADPFWAASYAELAADAALLDVLLPRLAGRLVIGNEMPPYLWRLLGEHGVPAVDLRIHPVRFLDDLILAARATDAAAQQVLAEFALPEEVVFATAGLVEAMCRYTADCCLPQGTLLVVGQRSMDATQIVQGGFFDALRDAEQVAAICARYPAVLLKPHPYCQRHSLLAAASAAPNRLAVTRDNLYRLLAQPQIGAVLTVNSSAAYEARYFGKPVHALAPLPIRLAWRGDPVAADAYVSLDDGWLCADFWRRLLAAYTAVTPETGVRLPAKPNRLRIAHDSFWNFQEIDTDRVPHGPELPA